MKAHIKDAVWRFFDIAGFIIWLIASIVSFVTLVIEIALFSVVSFCAGKHFAKEDDPESALTDFDHWWPIVLGFRILPWHIFLLILAAGFVYGPTTKLTVGAIEWALIIAIVALIFLWVISVAHSIAKWTGFPLLTDPEFGG